MSAAADPATLIREARKRAEKATPGPWDGDRSDFNVWAIRGPHGAEVVADYVDKPNARFIAAARTDVPALCDLAEEQAREIGRLRKEVSRMRPVVVLASEMGQTCASFDERCSCTPCELWRAASRFASEAAP